MKRLIITGLACPPGPWEQLFPVEGSRIQQRILPLVEILENSESADPRVMSRYVTEQIEAFGPDSIVCHDLGVPLTLLSLLRLNRVGVARDTKVTLFNGAFRKFDVFKANHPFRAQILTYKQAIREIESQGGTVDLRLKKYVPRLRAMYRLIILFGIAERVSTAFGLDDFIGLRGKLPLRSPVQIIASRNDPYIPFEALEQLRQDFAAQRFVELDYGHFPYSTSSPNRIRRLVEEFEGASAKRPRARTRRPSAKPAGKPTSRPTSPSREAHA